MVSIQKGLAQIDRKEWLSVVSVLVAVTLLGWVWQLHQEALLEHAQAGALVRWLGENRHVVEQAVAEVAAQAPAKASFQGSLVAQLSDSAKRNNLEVQRIEPERQGARLRLEAATLADLVAWFEQLQGQGVRIDQLSVDKSEHEDKGIRLGVSVVLQSTSAD